MSRDASIRAESDAYRLGVPVQDRQHKIGAGFSALHFSEDMFGGRMDPLIMVDHFVMTVPTFEPHLHAGISAVTFIFEDAIGDFLNRDTLGSNITLRPGDLYWLTAASGAVHDERPGPNGARTHALQIFVNLPARLKAAPASSLHVGAIDMPELVGSGYRVRIALGRSGEKEGATGTPQDITILDGAIDANNHFAHRLFSDYAGWLYVVSGELDVKIDGEHATASAGSSIAVASAANDGELVLTGNAETRCVLIASPPLHERFVKRGPLVMSTTADVKRILRDYAAGRYGNIAS